MKKRIYTLLTFIIYLSPNLQSQWTLSDTKIDQHYSSVSAVDNNIVWACGWDGIVVRTINGGASWTNSVVTPDTAQLFFIFGIDQNKALVVSRKVNPKFSSVWKTINGGSSWTEVFSQNNGSINSIVINTDGSGFMIGDPVESWTLFKTTNEGSSWTPANPLQQVNNEYGYADCFYSNGTNYWFGTSTGNIYYSSNSGDTWTNQVSNAPFITDVWFNGSIGIAGGFHRKRSTNFGSTWESITIPGIAVTTDIVGYGSIFWFVDGAAATIQKSEDSGLTWNAEVINGTNGVSDFSRARNGNKIWLCGTLGGKLAYTEFSLEITTTLSEDIAAGSNEIEVENPGLFSVGDETIINPGGSTEETNRVTGFGSLILNTTLLHNHSSGEIIKKVILTSVEESSNQPYEFSLQQNYPNPFNPSTKISWQSPVNSWQTLKIFDVLGNEIATLVDEYKAAGVYEVEFNASGLTSGVYFYQLKAGNLSESRKMIILR